MNRISIYQVRLEKVNSFLYERNRIHSVIDAVSILRHYLNHYCSTDRENFITVFLNTKNKITGISTIHVGSLNASIVHPREVFTEAILHKSASIIVCHNHPSGEVTPSQEDISITRVLKEAGELLGIEVLDHIILGEYEYFSMKEGGHM